MNRRQFEKTALLIHHTDWLDGLNKEMSEEDSRYYLHEYNMECHDKNQSPLAFPKRDYIVQIARFDPSKGIDVSSRKRTDKRCDTDSAPRPWSKRTESYDVRTSKMQRSKTFHSSSLQVTVPSMTQTHR